MNRTSTLLLGTGLLAFGLAAPLAASADEDNALAFVIGAAVGHALDDDRRHLRHPHRRHVVHVHRGHGAKLGHRWHGRYCRDSRVHRWQPPGRVRHHVSYKQDRRWHHRDHRRHDRDDRYDRRHYRDDRRHDRKHRDDRRWDRRG